MKKNNKELIIERALSDTEFRQALVQDSFYWFLHIYLPDYITHPFAKFHKEMIHTLQELDTNAVIAAFRGSGKSTVVSLGYVIWCMIGKRNKRFIVLGSNTTRQAELLMFNIKNILESHALLKRDLGPFSEFAEEWNVSSLVFKRYDTKIMAISVNESIRGIRYKNKRPDLIILDDVETLDSVRTEENREKLIRWFDRDIVPLGDEDTNTVVIGTIMTSGSLIQTLEDRISLNLFSGTFRRYPITEGDKILWPERWGNQKAIDNYRKKMGIVDRAWETEYLLNDFVEEDQVVKPEMIIHYEELPFGPAHFLGGFIGVDLAISPKNTAAKTAILCGYAFKINGNTKLYLLPYPTNERLNFHDTIEKIKKVALSMKSEKDTYIFVEKVGYQEAVIETLLKEGFHRTKPFEIKGQDKQARLETTLHNLAQGKIIFPEKGCEELIVQLVRFKFEKFKDLADAFSIIAIKTFEHLDKSPGVIAIDSKGIKDSISPRSTEDWAEREDREMFRRLGGKGSNFSIQFRD